MTTDGQFSAKFHNLWTIILTALLALAPVVALLGGLRWLNIAGMIAIFVLFISCIVVVPLTGLVPFYGTALWVLVFGFLLNTVYELAHSPLFTHFSEPGYTYPQLVLMLLGSAVADAFIALLLFLAATLLERGQWQRGAKLSIGTTTIILALAIVGQIVAELVALRSGEWAYNRWMPVIPVLQVGLTPIIQMPLLVLPVFWLARRVARPWEATHE